MVKYLKKFETTTEYTTAKSTLDKPNVSYIAETNGVEYNPLVKPNVLYDAEIEYLESSGTQYIDTGLKAQDGDEFGLIYQQVTLDNAYRSLFGATEMGTFYRLFISQTLDTSYVANIRNDVIPRDKNRHTLSWLLTTNSSPLHVVIDGITYTVDTEIRSISGWNVMVFARNANESKMIGKVYGYYQKHNGEYKINLTPVRIGNVGYMYDKVSGQLFGNAGTGAFILGADK